MAKNSIKKITDKFKVLHNEKTYFQTGLETQYVAVKKTINVYF